MSKVLIGYTGYVGRHLREKMEFDQYFRRSNCEELRHLRCNLLVCSGLPAAKWFANSNPDEDWNNVCILADVLQSVEADKAVLISTIDVFGSQTYPTEQSNVNLSAEESYGRNRAWFERAFRAQFEDALIVRLPGLFSRQLRKNLVFDLLHERTEFYSKVNRDSEFQFFNTELLWDYITRALELDLRLLNIATEPVTADDVAGCFGVRLNSIGPKIKYSMLTNHAAEFGKSGVYLDDKQSILHQISALKRKF